MPDIGPLLKLMKTPKKAAAIFAAVAIVFGTCCYFLNKFRAGHLSTSQTNNARLATMLMAWLITGPLFPQNFFGMEVARVTFFATAVSAIALGWLGWLGFIVGMITVPLCKDMWLQFNTWIEGKRKAKGTGEPEIVPATPPQIQPATDPVAKKVQ